ncbi:MAG: hypothetical protein NWQ47_03485 [Crocinitomicaceae bacterium]|nr:hypothetical protein [Crocinitomicaceae bacterium]
MKLIVIAILIGFSLFSCTITKRQFNRGYHIEWNKNYSNQEMAANSEGEIITESNNSSANPQELELNHASETTHNDLNEPIPNDINNNTTKVSKGFEVNEKLKSFPIKLKSTIKRGGNALSNKLTKIKQHKKDLNIGQPILRSPREYLLGALWCLLIGVVLVGIAILFIVAVEVEGLSIGGIFVYLALVTGGITLIAIPILLLLALIAYLFGY